MTHFPWTFLKHIFTNVMWTQQSLLAAATQCDQLNEGCGSTNSSPRWYYILKLWSEQSLVGPFPQRDLLTSLWVGAYIASISCFPPSEKAWKQVPVICLPMIAWWAWECELLTWVVFHPACWLTIRLPSCCNKRHSPCMNNLLSYLYSNPQAPHPNPWEVL